jgi:DNA-binding response OmpR family regulator
MIILCVDDDQDDLDLLQEAIQELNPSIRVFCVSGAEEALVWLHEHKALPTHVFIDINMPRINGLDLLRQLRKQREYDHVSVIIYSTSGSSLHIQEARALGARYLVKPNRFTDIQHMVKELLMP